VNLSKRHRARLVLAVAFCAALGGCDKPPAQAESRPEAPAATNADPQPSDDAELEAVRVLLRHLKSRIDGVMPPASWPDPGAVRRAGDFSWVVDIDTSRLPGGYPEQLVVEVTAAGGHTGQPKR